MRATKALVHLSHLKDNIRSVRNKTGAGVKICMPVKADAYGHGAVQIAAAALAAGVEYLGVATAEEAAELRDAGISAPILLFSLPLPEELPDLILHNIEVFAADRDFIRALAERAAETGKAAGVHLKIDTGMGRLGCRPEDAAGLAAYINSFSSLHYLGTATHLAVADSLREEDVAFTGEQLDRFRKALASIREAGFDPGIVHAANSGAVTVHDDSYFDMVRPGLMLYGYPPVPEAAGRVPVKALMELETAVVFIKRVRKGETLSYGRTWTAPRDTLIATLPVGYGDGISRALSNNYSVSIRGKLYPLVGRICMDQCMADLGPDTDIERWERVSLFGGPPPCLGAADMAGRLGTIPYEITCNISRRIPRIYKE